MKIENVEVYGFRRAFHGMRSPKNSWKKSDSSWTGEEFWGLDGMGVDSAFAPDRPCIGPEDMKLACKLIKGGSEHRKFLRQIMIWVDITIPRYVWTELDTYKVATVRNSCSTMHKLGTKDLTQEDFELPIPPSWLDHLNSLGEEFREAKLLRDTKEMNIIRRTYKDRLPEGFLQKATYTMSYETALNMYFQRRNHRLPEWNTKQSGSICSFIASLPYMREFIEAKEK